MGDEFKDDLNGDAMTPRSPYDPDPIPDEDLWFMPDPDIAPDPDFASTPAKPAVTPWPLAAQEASLDLNVWSRAEARSYRALVSTAEAVARFAERLRNFPEPVAERFAIASVSSVLRGEGLWLSPEQIALYQAFRTGTDDSARDLARAAWAMRRLGPDAQSVQPADDLRSFLGRSDVNSPQTLPGDDRPVGADLDTLCDDWSFALKAQEDRMHSLTRAAFGYALWRSRGITPWEDHLEPTLAAMRIGAHHQAPFLPMADGHRLDRHALQPGIDGAAARLDTFYAAARAGALAACMELDRLATWHTRAARATADLSGRTPPLLVAALLRNPVISADLVASQIGCSRPAARRNLNLFSDRGLIREVTGQTRYRFWKAAI